MKPTRFIDSANCAIEGILYTARTQKHMRNHFLAALVLLIATLFLRVSALEFILLALSVSFVLFAELMNTAVEVVVDLVSPGYHPLARIAKDTAAGAVLVAAIGTAVMGYLILSRYIFPIYKEVLGMIGTPTEMGTLVSILMVVIVVIILKARSGKGTPLQGGLPSGHAAVAFSIATSVSLNTQDPMISLLTIALAIMVSHSRLLLNIHSMREVVFGALTGTGITLAMLLLFRFAG
ncbi:diacylglycerol kinase [Geotalea uraniireducens]|uniref:Diacylglycerol kinase n=1 Tax=Geotalea uraniireducens (strain Rf4) TaxID=351605 RepID=A5GEW8_GEOUR|nr:diacylglycerol kinase [Geotalea uraniireducens]ABQ25973.1 diacylglycerol kinase [Geotalea uraniireducens Rf4]